MGLLPDIVDGKIVLSKEEEKEQRRFHNNLISKERKMKLIENMGRIKARHQLEDAKNADKNLGDLNNEGHAEVTADFSDSPHADRADEPAEEEEITESDD